MTALDGVDLTVHRGEVVALLGPNGAGKSTTLRILLGFSLADSGEVSLFGQTPNIHVLRRVGYLPEQRGLFEGTPIRTLIAWFGEVRGAPAREALREADAWLERLDLTSRAREPHSALSKGNQQKVQLAVAMTPRPELLVLDEPFSGLDPLNQQLFLDTFHDAARAGTGVLISTHEIDRAEQLGHRICLVVKGRVHLDDQLSAIRARAVSARWTIRYAEAGDARWLSDPRIAAWTKDADAVHVQLVDDGAIEPVLQGAIDAGLRLRGVDRPTPSLREIVVDQLRGAASDGFGGP